MLEIIVFWSNREINMLWNPKINKKTEINMPQKICCLKYVQKVRNRLSVTLWFI